MGDCAHPRLARARRRLPSLLRRQRASGAVLTSLRASSAHDSARSPALRCERRRSSRTIFRAEPSFHAARQQKLLTPRADRRPAVVSRSVAQPPREFRGGFALAEQEGAASLSLAPPLSRRGAWRGERKVFPCCSAAAPACAALTRGVAGSFAAASRERPRAAGLWQIEAFAAEVLSALQFTFEFDQPIQRFGEVFKRLRGQHDRVAPATCVFGDL